MLIVQRYNSLSEIDAEFKEAVEKLLASEVESFQFLLESERKKPETKFFYYYLFFGNSTNLPVGIACFEYEKLDPKKYLPWQKRFKQLFGKKETPTLLRLSSDTNYRNFFYFEPKHLKLGLIEVKKIFEELKKRPGVVFHEVMITPSTKSVLVDYINIAPQEKIIQISPLKKTFQTYQDYFLNLDSEQQSLIKNAWKRFTKDLGLEIKEKENELMIHKDGQAFFTITAKLSAHKVYFIDFSEQQIPPELNAHMILQNVLMKFYENTQANELVINNRLKFTIEELSSQRLLPYSIDRVLKGCNDFVATKIFDHN